MEIRLVGQKDNGEDRFMGRMHCRVSCNISLSSIILWWRGVKQGEGQGTHTQRRLSQHEGRERGQLSNTVRIGS